MRIAGDDLEFAGLAALVVGLPLFFLFGALWNPHDSFGSAALHYVGLFGIAPLLHVSDLLVYRLGLAGFIAGCIVQYAWFALWALLLRLLWKVRYPK